MIRKKHLAIVPLLLLTGCIFVSAANAADTPSCDRECLKGFVTKYLDAMITHKPESVPVASTFKYTEDCKELKLGEGEWKIITGLTEYRRDVLDVKEGVAVSFNVVTEKENNKALYTIRLKVVDKKITELETQAVHNKEEAMLLDFANLKTISKTMAFVPEKKQLLSREDLIKAGRTYADGLKVGSFVKVDSPMAPDAYRFENGQLMAGPGCTFFKGCDVMKTQTIPRLAGITQRVMAVDEEMGVVAIRMNFGPGSTFRGGGELDVFHSFKIYDGVIRAAEAFFKQAPAGTKSGWD
ncbi:MAG: hypothetical protein LUQ05_04250 [Methanoregula sp.]|nr:hypothetical protein [Methanoregula sp.]